MFEYRPKGVCSQRFLIDIKDDTIQDIRIEQGCQGNLGGISRLVKGMRVQDVIDRIEGIQCRNGTSCPDQLSRALRQQMKDA